MTIEALMARYWRWAETYYRDCNGEPSQELDNIRLAPANVEMGCLLRAHSGQRPSIAEHRQRLDHRSRMIRLIMLIGVE